MFLHRSFIRIFICFALVHSVLCLGSNQNFNTNQHLPPRTPHVSSSSMVFSGQSQASTAYFHNFLIKPDPNCFGSLENINISSNKKKRTLSEEESPESSPSKSNKSSPDKSPHSQSPLSRIGIKWCQSPSENSSTASPVPGKLSRNSSQLSDYLSPNSSPFVQDKFGSMNINQLSPDKNFFNKKYNSPPNPKSQQFSSLSPLIKQNLKLTNEPQKIANIKTYLKQNPKIDASKFIDRLIEENYASNTHSNAHHVPWDAKPEEIGEREIITILTKAPEAARLAQHLPRIDWEHLTEATNTGYHQEHLDDSGPQVMRYPALDNPQTGSYAGCWQKDKSNKLKFSTFFPKTLSQAEIFTRAQSAFRNPIAQEEPKESGDSYRLIGYDGKGGNIEMAVKQRGLVVQPYPTNLCIIEPNDTADKKIKLASVQTTVGQLQKLKGSTHIRYTTPEGTINEVAPSLVIPPAEYDQAKTKILPSGLLVYYKDKASQNSSSSASGSTSSSSL